MTKHLYEKRAKQVSVPMDVYMWLQTRAMMHSSHISKEVCAAVEFYRKYQKFEGAIEKQYYHYGKVKDKKAEELLERMKDAPMKEQITLNMRSPNVPCPGCQRMMYKEEMKKCSVCGKLYCRHCHPKHFMSCYEPGLPEQEMIERKTDGNKKP